MSVQVNHAERVSRGWPAGAARGVFARATLVATVLASTAGFAVALWPEPPARILTPPALWIKSSGIGEFIPAGPPPQFRQVRESVQHSRDAILYRNYRPETGLRPGAFASGPFRADGVLSVVVEGSADISLATVSTFISCSTSNRQIQVERGGVNVNVSEALVEIPRGWCTGDLRLMHTTTSADFGGVGSVSALAPISGLKQSFIGLLPYLTTSIVIFSLMGLAGALALRTLIEPLPAAMAAIGAVFLTTFFIYALAPHALAQLSALFLSLPAVGIFFVAPRKERRRVVVALFPYAASWILVCLSAAALLALAYNGNGHWEPNYRFQPAQWSSDFELPWIFAEALRKNYDLRSLFGSWQPTDRPPLMTGGHLLVSELFSAMQSGNDGDYLRGIAYNMSAIAMSALWAPAVLYFFVSTLRVPWRRAVILMLFMAALPFFVFNTIYGWPKLLGGAFGVLATVAALEHWRREPQTSMIDAAVLFGAFAALSILAHASNGFFLLPVGIFIFFRRLWRAPKALAAGAGTGLIMMAPWTLYQRVVAPSDNPLLKYALAGDFGFGAPHKSVLDWVLDRYASLPLSEWTVIKAKLVISPFWPVRTGISDMLLPKLIHANLFDTLRQWDFYFLSGGNAVLLIGLVALCFRPIRTADNDDSNTLLPAQLVGKLSCFSFLLIVLTFFPVLIIHVLPYALIVSAGAAGLAALSLRPALFRAIASLTLAYVVVVWIGAPLVSALRIDWLAGLVLLVVMVNMWFFVRERSEMTA
jgi:hypothetical protein